MRRILRSFGAFPQMLISDSERAWCLFCADLAVRRHQLLACRDSYAELLDRRGDATWFLTVGRLLEPDERHTVGNPEAERIGNGKSARAKSSSGLRQPDERRTGVEQRCDTRTGDEILGKSMQMVGPEAGDNNA